MSGAKYVLITCHANADFDAFAAMLAARHLYENSVLFFPGTQERGLQKIYTDLNASDYCFIEASNVAWEKIDRLVLVDTRQRGRVRHVAQLLDKPDVRIEAWDHHPNSPDDIAIDLLHVAQVGAVTSLLIQKLRDAGIFLDSDEATLLGLGIYSDTGSFTYSSTTGEDFQAASWLLSQGMDVNRINDMASHELTSLHIHALNSLLESACTYTFNNVQVVLADAPMDHYLGDFAGLAQKMMEMEKFSVFFAIGLMGDRIQVVARSRNSAVNVGNICLSLGGGGHAYAASASIRNMTLQEVRDAILRCLYEQVNPGKTAREYMSSPVIGIETGSAIRDADALMLHYGIKTLIIFNKGTRNCAGFLDTHIATRAIAHGLGDSEVDEYMQRHVLLLSPEATLRDLTAVIVGTRQRLAPIVEGGDVVGVVTRTDLINVFANEPGWDPGQTNRTGKERNVGKYMQDRLPQETRAILQLVGSLGNKLRLPVYVVGGFVRDLLLNQPNLDIDLVVEGNGIALARALAGELNGRVREHQKFLTSVVIFRNAAGAETRIDVATARLEYYEYPAALPTVELSSIKMDLFRRDFSINALAVRLDNPYFGRLVDFFGGQRDIKDKTIRALNTLSFVEDPTRCLRAVLFEQRYKFKIGVGTEKLIKNALGLNLMDRLSASRLFYEYKHICDEAEPLVCFTRLNEIGVLQALAPQFALNPKKILLLRRITEMLAWYRLLYFDEIPQAWLLYFFGLNVNLTYSEANYGYSRLGLPKTKKKEILRQHEQTRAVYSKLENWQRQDDAGAAKVSLLCEMLYPISLECVLYLMAFTENSGLQKNLSRYITQWRREKPDIGGMDLHNMGLAQGPIFGRILKTVLNAKLDGEAVSRESQLELADELAHVLYLRLQQ
ncbi:MAG: CBS domain-containing protein [Desulfovibrio sp.]|jgi:tRNA nucleotidyltransferase (CCA-adding enzyme)|nr:CBS domain-containing protein [Desulfovibrio sp.]